MQQTIDNQSLSTNVPKPREDLVYKKCFLQDTPIKTDLSQLMGTYDAKKIQKLKDILERKTIEEAFLNKQVSPWGNTALILAVANTSSSSALLLLNDSRIKTNIKDYVGKIALHLALGKGWQHINNFPGLQKQNQASIIVELIKRKEDLNIQDNNGNTPLHIAVLRRDIETVKMLLKAGALPDTPNKFGYTPVDMLDISYDDVYSFLDDYVGAFTLSKTRWNLKKLMIEQALYQNLAKDEENHEALDFFENTHFNNMLEMLLLKSEELHARGFPKVAEQVSNLVKTLVEDEEKYKQTGNLENFKQQVMSKIEHARPELEKHRGFKWLLEAMVQLFIEIGRCLGVVSGNNSFFKTDTACKLDELKHVLSGRN